MVKKSARRTRRTHTPTFKARVALAALREDKTMAKRYSQFEPHANQITKWKRQLLEHASDVFGAAPAQKEPVDLVPLHAKIGQLTPEIVNTDQGSQFTAEEFTEVVLANGCKLSRDRRGSWRDNVFVERIWRSVKYEQVYLKAYDSVSAARAARADIADYLAWHNTQRPLSNLEPTTPEQVYLNLLRKLAEAA